MPHYFTERWGMVADPAAAGGSAKAAVLPWSDHRPVPSARRNGSAVRGACASQLQRACQALIRGNVALNAAAVAAAGGSAEAAVLAWGATNPRSLPGAWSAPDLIIAADVVYHRALFEPLLATLAAFGAPGWLGAVAPDAMLQWWWMFVRVRGMLVSPVL